MAVKGDSAVLNLGEIGEEGLNFSSGTTHTFEGQVPDSALDNDDDDNDKAGLLSGDGDQPQQPQQPQAKATNYNFFSLAFYRQFFDVDTEDVKQRVVWSLTPRPKATSDFVLKSIRPNPDLYGPFWVCVTLIFSVAISGNVASYLHAGLTSSGASESGGVKGYRWHYDFHKVTLAASVVFGYAWLVPAGLYGVIWAKASGASSQGQSQGQSLASISELLCVYGYSLSIFIPVSVLWTIQSSALRWTLVGVAGGLSGAVLVLALWNTTLKDSLEKKVAFALMAVVIALHLLLALGFMLLFFYYAPVASAAVASVTQPPPLSPAATGSDNPSLPVVTEAPAAKDGGQEEKSSSVVPKEPPKVEAENAKKDKVKKAADDDDSSAASANDNAKRSADDTADSEAAAGAEKADKTADSDASNEALQKESKPIDSSAKEGEQKEGIVAENSAESSEVEN